VRREAEGSRQQSAGADLQSVPDLKKIETIISIIFTGILVTCVKSLLTPQYDSFL
jgi:hypothetical protein